MEEDEVEEARRLPEAGGELASLSTLMLDPERGMDGWINGVTHGWQGHGGMSYQMSHIWILPE
jgi:hypothetical protein